MQVDLGFPPPSDLSMEAPGPPTHERWPGAIDLNQAAPQDDLPSVSGQAHEAELRSRSSPSANGTTGQSDEGVGRSRRQSGSPLEIDAISRMLYFASQGSVDDIQAMLDDGAGERRQPPQEQKPEPGSGDPPRDGTDTHNA